MPSKRTLSLMARFLLGSRWARQRLAKRVPTPYVLCYNVTLTGTDPTLPATTLLVCTRCRPPGAEPEAPRAGATLLAAARRAAAGEPSVRVHGVACLSGCRRACAAALMAPGKVGYLFGDLPPDPAGAADLLAAALAHAAAPEGHLPRAARPERLRTGILGRLPPLHWLPDDPGAVVAWPPA